MQVAFIFLALWISLRFLLLFHIVDKYRKQLEHEERQNFKLLISSIARDKKKFNAFCDHLNVCHFMVMSWIKKAPPKLVMMQVMDWLKNK